MSKKKVYVVPHSHWDREWYFTIEDSNVLLCENFLFLMEVLEADEEFRSYSFDAQLSVVEEFLKYYPEERERMQHLIEKKRIFVGPWYTQTDTLLVNKESMIRNLLIGTRMGNALGHSMQVGYLPDIFGQNAYLPSIFQEFGIEDSVLQRGIYDDQLKENLNFVWSSPDGKKVRANNIYLGYGPGKFLSDDNEYINAKLKPMLEKLVSLNKDTDNLLLPSGGDQVLIRKDFPRVVNELNEKSDEYEFVLSDYESFMKDTWKDCFDNEIEGELIGCQKSRIHNTIRSQRVDIKQVNTEVENKILYILEPLSVIAKQFGIDYKHTWIDSMWKQLFDVHAHDSIGGCNSDETNANIIHRLTKVNQACDNLTHIIKRKISTAVAKNVGHDNVLVVFNLLLNKQEKNYEATVFTSDKDFLIESIEGDALPFEVMNQTSIDGGKQVIVTAEGEKEVSLPSYYESRILLPGLQVKGMGFATLKVIDKRDECTQVDKGVQSSAIENEWYKISLEGGSLQVLNKKTKQTVENFLGLEECADIGDSYDFSPLEGESNKEFSEFTLENSKIATFYSRLELSASKKVAQDLVQREELKRNIDFNIHTTIELRKGDELIYIKHKIDNQVKDHRVRALVKAPIKSSQSRSDQAFSTVTRTNINPYLNEWKQNKFVEAPVAIYPLENFVVLEDAGTYLGIVTKGLKEYEVIENQQVAITLFRSVGLLGKDNLPYRPGRASGINNKVVETPDAQMQKEMTFEYAVTMGQEKDVDRKMFSLVDRFISKYATYQTQRLNLFKERLERFELPLNQSIDVSEYSFFEVDNQNLFMSVCKEANDKEGIIVRLFNPTKDNQEFAIKVDKEVYISDLREYKKEKAPSVMKVKAKGYITLKF